MVLHQMRGQVALMTNHRKHRGYRTQKVIADYLKQWWEYADTAGAGRQGEDILNIPHVSIEVKARADFQPLAWIKQSAANSKGRLPIVIMRCNGQGEDAGEYLMFGKVKDLMGFMGRLGSHLKEQVGDINETKHRSDQHLCKWI